MQVGLYARVSTHDQQTLALQREAMEAYVQQRAWEIAVLVEEVGSGGRERWQREAQGDRIFIPSIDVDERFEGDRITGSWVVDQGSTLLLLLEI